MWWVTLALVVASTQKERAPDRVARIVIEGNTDTPGRVIQGQLGLWSGQILDYTRLPAARDRLRRCGLFEDAAVEVLPNEFDSQFKDVLVRVRERPGNWAAFAVVEATAGLITVDVELLVEATDWIRSRLR